MTVSDAFARAQALLSQDRRILLDGLEKAGIKDTTISKLRTFEGFADSTAGFLNVTLDITQRMLIYQLTALFEESEHIRATKLHGDNKMSELDRVSWQRAFNEISEMIGKGHDRMFAGAEALAKLMAAEENVDKTARPKKWKTAKPYTHG